MTDRQAVCLTWLMVASVAMSVGAAESQTRVFVANKSTIWLTVIGGEGIHPRALATVNEEQIELWEVPETAKHDPTIDLTAVPEAGATCKAVDETTAKIGFESAVLEGNKRYLLVLPVEINEKTVRWAVPFSTEPEATFEHQLDGTIVISSPVALEDAPSCVDGSRSVTLDIVSRPKGIDARGNELPEKKRTVEAEVCRGGLAGDPDSEGQLRVLGISAPVSRSLTAVLKGTIRNAFGQEIKAKGTLKPAEAPKEKKDSMVFVSLKSVIAEGKKPATSLDLKAEPVLPLGRGWLFRPKLEGDVSHNVSKASDSLSLAAVFSYTGLKDVLQKKRQTRNYLLTWGPADPPDDSGCLVGSIVDVGGQFEADDKLDQANAVFRAAWTPLLRGGNRSRSVKQANAASDHQRKLEEVFVAWGSGFTLTLFGEAGGSLKDQSIQNSDNSQSTTVQRFDILRAGLEFSAFLEFGRATWTLNARIPVLFEEERAFRELDDKSLVVEGFDGIQTYIDSSLQFAVDPNKNLALAVTYKRGRKPPLYKSINSVEIGLIAKF